VNMLALIEAGTPQSLQQLIDLHVSQDAQLALDDLVFDHGEALNLDEEQISEINNGGPIYQIGWLAAEAELETHDFLAIPIHETIVSLALRVGEAQARSM